MMRGIVKGLLRLPAGRRLAVLAIGVAGALLALSVAFRRGRNSYVRKQQAANLKILKTVIKADEKINSMSPDDLDAYLAKWVR